MFVVHTKRCTLFLDDRNLSLRELTKAFPKVAETHILATVDS